MIAARTWFDVYSALIFTFPAQQTVNELLNEAHLLGRFFQHRRAQALERRFGRRAPELQLVAIGDVVGVGLARLYRRREHGLVDLQVLTAFCFHFNVDHDR